MDWNDFRYALAVADHRSLSRAGQALGVHQTTVGRRIEALEATLGFALFLRSPAGMIPTGPAGRVLASLRELGATLSRLEDHAADEAALAGTVRLAVTEVMARRLIRRALPALRLAHPELTVELIPGNQVIDLARGDADLAIRVVRPQGGDLIARRLGAVTYGLYAAAAYLSRRGALGPGLAGHDVVWPSRELARGPEATWLEHNATQARVALWSPSLLALGDAAAAGLGLAVLPTNHAALHAPLVLARALDEIPARPVWLVMHRDTHRLARVQAVARAVTEELTGASAPARAPGPRTGRASRQRR